MAMRDIDITVVDTAVESMAFIVGSNHFQNVLFAAYIETHSQWKSAVVDNSRLLPTAGKGTPGRTAVFYDCFGLLGPELEKSVLDQLEMLPANWFPILFNLDRHEGVERKALENGVRGFFYQDDAIETLRKGLTAIFGGEFWVSRRMMADVILENGFRLRHRQINPNVPPHDLTRREVEILSLLTLGASNDIIADKLFISPHTVRTHLSNIFRKIKVASRLEASIWASETLYVRR